MNIFVESPAMDDVVQALGRLSNVVELYKVTGEYDIIAVVSVASVEEFRDLLIYKILKINGVRNTTTSVVFNAPKCSRYLAEAQRTG